MAHLTWVKQERSYYQRNIEKSKISLEQHGIEPTFSRSDQNIRDITSQYSFNYVQQIHLPFSLQLTGPLYFFAPYKGGLFGVSCESAGRMVTYAIPEIAKVDKGSNSVISFLRHSFENFVFGEKEVTMNADNCTG